MLTACLGGAAVAQEPDTIPADTVGVPPLTLPGGIRAGEVEGGDIVPSDTVEAPPPSLPWLPLPGPATAARGVWEWDRDALRRLPDLSLLHLLERLPGVVPVRADVANQVEAASIFGATAGAIRYVVDGFELDPLAGATLDPSRLPLLGLERVRVERRLTGATVHLETLSPTEPQPRTIIEAGAGDYDVQLFRGVFLAPSVLGGPLALGFERLAADGAIGGTSNHVAGWMKWSWVRDSAGVQVEYRQGSMDRAGVRDGLSGVRRDWVVRARAARGPVTGEVYAGASRVEDERGEALVREGTPHGGLRLHTALDGPVPMVVRTALRLRDHPRLPFGELELGVRAAPLSLVAVEAEAVRGWWHEGPGTGRWTTRAQVGPVEGLLLFSEIFGGDPLPGAGWSVRSPSPAGDSPLQVRRAGVRAGAELRLGRASLLAAGLRTRADVVPGFGLAFEPSFPRVAGGVASGLEVVARLPTGLDPLTLDGWYVGMDAPPDWLYLPSHHWRTGLNYHHLPLPSGNLELAGRLEHVFRGRMAVPGVVAAGNASPFTLTEVGGYRATNFQLGIRVLTVQAFLRWENILHRQRQQDLVEFFRPGQHVLYGVKWEFLN